MNPLVVGSVDGCFDDRVDSSPGNGIGADCVGLPDDGIPDAFSVDRVDASIIVELFCDTSADPVESVDFDDKFVDNIQFDCMDIGIKMLSNAHISSNSMIRIICEAIVQPTMITSNWKQCASS